MPGLHAHFNAVCICCILVLKQQNDSLDQIDLFWCFGISTWPVWIFWPEFAFQLFLPYVTFKPTVILPSFSQPIGYYTVCTRYGTYKEVEHVNLQNEVSYIYFKITTLDFQNHKIQHCFLFSPCLLFSIQFLYEIGIILIHRFIWPIAPHKNIE